MSVFLWLVRDVPAWLVGVGLIIGIPALVLGLDRLIHRWIPHARLSRHNDVTGVMVAAVAVLYGVLVGLCVVWLWEGMTDAEDSARDEATNLAALVPASAVFEPETQRRLAEAVVKYNEDVIHRWQLRRHGDPAAEVTADLDGLAGIVATLHPTTEAQRAFVEDAVARIVRGQELRRRSLLAARQQQMSPVLWFGVAAMTVAFLVVMLFFGLDDPVVRRFLIALTTAVVAINLFLIVQMNYTYYGAFAVGPDSYREVIKDLNHFLTRPR